MEYLPDGALDDLLLAGRQLTPAVAASLVADVADAVAAAHRAGVIHRDLKPANILLGEPWDAGAKGAAPRVKVADFGLAKLDQFDVTRQGVLVGTPAYMAPEQASGRPGEVGTATDIWALGVVLYELLAGRRPFPSENPAETLMALTHAEPEALRQANPAVPRDLETICRKCLAKAPAQRYRTADALADDLRAFLEGRPIAARPTQAWEHAARLARRHPVPAAALVILVAGLAGAFGWVNAARVRETAARQAADERERQAKVALAGADATLHFFEDKLLSAAGPKGGGGGLDKDVTLREAITAALPDLATRFTDQPVVESRLRRTVGAAFRNLGDAAVALGQFERAAALSAEHLGPDDPHTLACRNGLALTYRALNRDEEAVKLHEEVLAARRRVLGSDHRDTLASLHSLAASLFALKRYPDALRIEEEALAGRRGILGPDHPDLLKSGNLMAAILSRVDRHAESVTLLEESLAAHRRVMGPDDPATLMAVHNLTYAYCLSQRLPESLRLLEECVAGRRRVLPPDHPHLLISVALLAKSLGDAGRGAEAVPLIDEYLALTAGKPADPNILPVLIKRRLRHFEAHCDAAGCRATAELFEKRNRPEADQFYLAARLRAVTAAVAASAGSPSDGAIDADRAMAWLTKAAAAGYSSRDGVSDFAALRGRADYQALAKAKLKAKPKGP